MPDLRSTTLTRPTVGLSLLASPPAWSERSACGTETARYFFASDGERGEYRRAREEAAKAICGRCHVRAECLTYAIDTRQHIGVWGGVTETERAELVAPAPEGLR